MSASAEPGRSAIGPSDGARETSPASAGAGAANGGKAEAFDALPVLAPEATVVRRYATFGQLGSVRRTASTLPAVQAAAAAAGGFVAGAAMVGFVHRRHNRAGAIAKGRRAGRVLRRSSSAARGPSRTAELVQIVGSRSLLVDVHLLGGRD